ncbi:Cysteine desulfurase, mitochondrial [Paramicrosporidium saccamoebae]|uniref:Cysteine desulfurase, mitosomal n=1 Tax=Paramicrosporidium saccamoebae TaxID=1246581 RepID=A0A2H9TQH8_9FUNG|nr:Cysteine desulfurase, mitochondrial [Paramicrosporidium saccamoebae]
MRIPPLHPSFVRTVHKGWDLACLNPPRRVGTLSSKYLFHSVALSTSSLEQLCSNLHVALGHDYRPAKLSRINYINPLLIGCPMSSFGKLLRGTEIGRITSFRRPLAEWIRNASGTSKGQSEEPKVPGFETTKSVRLAGRPVYLDLQATTPMDPRVLDSMLPFLTEQFGNPHSRTHAYGWEAEAATEAARGEVASLIGADPKEVIFTSGATESNNIAVKGVTRFYTPKKNHVITTQTEHKCVLDSCRQLEEEGFRVTYLPVQKNGIIDLAALEAAITPETALVSVMAVNNEIGVVQPLRAIGELCRRSGVFFHTDAAQAVGKIPIDVNAMSIDLLSISGHKLYGPKGVGALYVRRRPRVRVHPLQTGGGQERGIRSGTVPTPLIVGLGSACRVAAAEMDYDAKHIGKLSEMLVEGITSKIPHVIRNGDAEHGYAGCVNLSFSHVEGESLLMALKNIALSSGSACTSASLEPSYVLRALGADDALAHSSIRFGLGRFTTEEEVRFCVDETVRHVSRLRELSPLWEMVQEGIDINSIQWSQH